MTDVDVVEASPAPEPQEPAKQSKHPVKKESTIQQVKGKVSKFKQAKVDAAEAAKGRRAEKRESRKQFIKEALADSAARYKEVFGVELTLDDIKKYSAHCKEHERNEFLRTRFVNLSSLDRQLLDEILAENVKAKGRKEE